MRIIAKNLVKIYGDRSVVNDVSFDVNKGEVVGILGPNGAGKTTTFYMVVGLVRANKGQVLLEEDNGNIIDITELPMNERAKLGIGYLPQETSIFRKLNVEDNLKLVLEMNDKLNQEQKDELLENLLTEFGVAKLRTAPSVALSGGERRRVEIAEECVIAVKFNNHFYFSLKSKCNFFIATTMSMERLVIGIVPMTSCYTNIGRLNAIFVFISSMTLLNIS